MKLFPCSKGDDVGEEVRVRETERDLTAPLWVGGLGFIRESAQWMCTGVCASDPDWRASKVSQHTCWLHSLHSLHTHTHTQFGSTTSTRQVTPSEINHRSFVAPLLSQQEAGPRWHTHTHTHSHTCTHTRTEGCLDQRAAVLFGRLTTDPFRAAHTGASCNAEPALLEFTRGKLVFFF